MKIIEKKELTVVGMKVVADAEALETEASKAWEGFYTLSDEIENRLGSSFLSVSVGTIDGRSTWVCGAAVDEVADLPPDLEVLQIAPGRYLHYRHLGPVEEISESLQAMHAWGRAQGYELDELTVDVGYTPDGADSGHDLMIRLLD